MPGETAKPVARTPGLPTLVRPGAADALEEAGFDVVPVVEESTMIHFARPNG